MSKVLVVSNEVSEVAALDIGNAKAKLYERSGEKVSTGGDTGELGIPANTVGEYIAVLSQRARIEYGEKRGVEINQADYAKVLNVSRATVQTWEAGHNLPKVMHLAVLCFHIGASVDEVAADLIRLGEPSLVPQIPKGLRDQQFSIPRFLEALEQMPNDILLQVHRQILNIMDKRFKRWVEEEKVNGNGES